MSFTPVLGIIEPCSRLSIGALLGSMRHSSVQTLASQFMQIPFRSFHNTYVYTLHTNKQVCRVDGWVGGWAGPIGRLVRMQKSVVVHIVLVFYMSWIRDNIQASRGLLLLLLLLLLR